VDGRKEAGSHRPAPAFADPVHLRKVLRDRILALVNRPGRYLGGESGAVRRPWRDGDAHVLLAFPDAYEVGISNNGLRILYAQLNDSPRTYADIAFAPWPDMAARMRDESLPLFALQSARPARDFDIVGFSLGYELSYTNVLDMIDLAGLPLLAADRVDGDPLVVAGGHCAANPNVMSPFVDVFCVGDGEEILVELADLARDARAEGLPRSELLTRARALPGVWPSADGSRVVARAVADLDATPPPANLVPIIEAVHDRLSLEVMRGCVRGCRFCQAGMITRPVRERSVKQVVESAVDGAARLGWSEVSLLSLSTGDYSGLKAAVSGIRETLAGTRTNLELPSLRVDSRDDDVFAMIGRERPGSFTFAPEAGSARLRNVINKNITEEDLLGSVRRVFASGARKVKLYFMMGLPTETDEDLRELVDLVAEVTRAAPGGGSQITVSVSPFAPKSHTPFQWAGQISIAEMQRRNDWLRERLRPLKVKISLRDPEVSALEAVLGLGDKRFGDVVLRAWELGAGFDGWDEWFNAGLWRQAFADSGIDPADYLGPRDPREPLPWDDVHARVDRDFLEREWRSALAGETTPDCRLDDVCGACSACDSVHANVFAPDAASAVDSTAFAAPEAPGFDPRNADPADPSAEKACWEKWRRQSSDRCWYRAEFTKDGDAAFLGHLDFQRLIQMALRRSGLPAAYSQGFHPHPQLRFGPPLPVGVSGDLELMDIAFTGREPDWIPAVNAELPAGVRILRTEMVGPLPPPAVEKNSLRFDFLAELPAPSTGGPDLGVVTARIESLLAAAEWPAVRRRPKGDIELDARSLLCDDMIEAAATPSGDGAAAIRFSLRRDPGNTGLSALEFLAALLGDTLSDLAWCRIRRLALKTRLPDGSWVSPLEAVSETNRRLWLRLRLSA